MSDDAAVTVEAIRARLEAATKLHDDARSAVMHGAVWYGFDGPDGVTKEEALEYAAAFLDTEAGLLLKGIAFLLAENARKDAIVEQVEAMAWWLRSHETWVVLPDRERELITKIRDVLDAILAGDTDRLPWGGE